MQDRSRSKPALSKNALRGFGSAPKFPCETLLELLLVHQRDHPDQRRMSMIRHALDRYSGQMTEISRRLGIGRSTLYRKVRELGLDVQE